MSLLKAAGGVQQFWPGHNRNKSLYAGLYCIPDQLRRRFSTPAAFHRRSAIHWRKLTACNKARSQLVAQKVTTSQKHNVVTAYELQRCFFITTRKSGNTFA
jgi:hypothetical protein